MLQNRMDPVLFKVAEAGNIGPFENCQTCLDQLLTTDENTILHVYLKNQSREPEFTDFVDTILKSVFLKQIKFMFLLVCFINSFNVLILKIKNLKNIILICFQTKNIF